MATNAVETCPICGGSGWKITERDGISGAEKCQCVDEGRAQRIEQRAGIPPLYEHASVDNFILPSGNPQARSALASVVLTVRGYVREYPHGPKPGLLFLGAPGTGKTHLAVAALRGLIAKGFEGIFYDFQSLLTRYSPGLRQGLRIERARGLSIGARRRDPAARRRGRAPHQRLGGRYRHVDRHAPLQLAQGDHCDEQPARSRGGRQTRVGLSGREYPQQIFSRGAHRDAGAFEIV